MSALQVIPGKWPCCSASLSLLHLNRLSFFSLSLLINVIYYPAFEVHILRASARPLLYSLIYCRCHPFCALLRENYMIMLLKIMPMQKRDWIKAREAIWFWHFLVSDCNCKILLTQFEMCNFPYLKKKREKSKLPKWAFHYAESQWLSGAGVSVGHSNLCYYS